MRSVIRQIRQPAALGAALGFAVLAGAGCGGGARAADPPAPGHQTAVQAQKCRSEPRRDLCRVLFLGNSYTYVNDLPGTFELLARAGGRNVRAGWVAWPNATLAEHLADRSTERALQLDSWQVVVLQEKSTIPGDESTRERYMVPAASALAREIRQSGAVPMLFETWGHREGEPEASLFGYPQMQAAVDRGYRAESRELHAPLAPVGEAWWAAYRGHLRNDLWISDGSHPTPAGTYLAACVFYATVFGRSPVGIGYHGGLGAHEARELQAIAARTAGV